MVFSPKDVDHILIVLKGATYYTLDTNQGYDDLYAYLTYQRRILKPKLGKLRQLSPVEEENIQKPIITAESLVPFQGRCFKQINNSNESMNAKEIEEMHLRSTVYYHVRITQKSDILGELKLDLSEEKLCSQFITPYENDENIFVNGKTITSDDIERIRINKTELNSSKLIPIIRAKRPKIGAPQISNEWLVTKEGKDVTDDLIKGEPGYKKKKFGEKMEEVKPKTNQIFVVHGHDEGMKEAVARTLKNIGLEPIILHEQANRGKTIIEKFETCSENVSFAVVLLSPDDKGYKADQEPESASYRARQNVILELGYFLGKLGRENVCALLKTEENFEFPSDIFGSLYTPYDSNSGWKLALAKELKVAGYDIDFGKL